MGEGEAAEPSGVEVDRPPERIELGDLALVRWRRGDLDVLHAAITESIDHLSPWMSWASRHDRGSVAEFLTESEQGWERGDRFEYAVRDRIGELVGSVGLMGRIGPGGLEIGYWVHASSTRRGIATRAAAALTDAAFALDSVDHVEVHHDEANLASGAVPARLGFRKLGVFAVEPKAPSETGRDARWRMDKRDFARSAASAMVAEERERTG